MTDDKPDWQADHFIDQTPEFNRGFADGLRLVLQNLAMSGEAADELSRLADAAEQTERKQTAEGLREGLARARVEWTPEYLRELYSQDDEHTHIPFEDLVAELKAKTPGFDPDKES